MVSGGIIPGRAPDRVHCAVMRRTGRSLLLVLAAACTAARPARALEVSFGAQTLEGDFHGDETIRLSEAPLIIAFGGAESRFSVRIPYVRIVGTGNVTLAADGPAIVGAGGRGRAPFQTSLAGESESGTGDIL